MKNYGEKILDKAIVDNILRTLNSNFDYIMLVVEDN